MEASDLPHYRRACDSFWGASDRGGPACCCLPMPLKESCPVRIQAHAPLHLHPPLWPEPTAALHPLLWWPGSVVWHISNPASDQGARQACKSDLLLWQPGLLHHEGTAAPSCSRWEVLIGSSTENVNAHEPEEEEGGCPEKQAGPRGWLAACSRLLLNATSSIEATWSFVKGSGMLEKKCPLSHPAFLLGSFATQEQTALFSPLYLIVCLRLMPRGSHDLPGAALPREYHKQLHDQEMVPRL